MYRHSRTRRPEKQDPNSPSQRIKERNKSPVVNKVSRKKTSRKSAKQDGKNRRSKSSSPLRTSRKKYDSGSIQDKIIYKHNITKQRQSYTKVKLNNIEKRVYTLYNPDRPKSKSTIYVKHLKHN